MSVKCWPFNSSSIYVSSPFGPRYSQEVMKVNGSTYHKGIDLYPQSGSWDVVSCMAGTVKAVQRNAGGSKAGYGNYVWVANNDGSACIYAHLARVYVKQGQSVSPKTRLGLMGTTGASTGNHLHLGVSVGSQNLNSPNWVNPAPWLGVQNYSNIKGKTFDGSGYVSGTAADITSVNDSTAASNESSGASISYSTIIPSGEYYKVDDLRGILGDWLYGRRYRVMVDIGGGQGLDVSELRCQFEIVKSGYFEANQSTLTIYNLNPDDENKLIKSGQRIIIEAGYSGGQYGKIFEGNVIQPLRSKENGVDYKLTLVSMDSDRYYQYGLVGVSLVAEQTSRDAIDACLNRAGDVTKENYGIVENNIGTGSIIYPRGKVMFGSPIPYLNQLAFSENGTFYIENGEANIVTAKDLSGSEIFSLGPENGLIGTPVQTQNGITCKCLLNPRMKVNTLFHIDNTKIENFRYTPGQAVRALDSEGIYRIIKMTHRGDTRSQDWYTEIEAISQVGILPSMVAGSDLYPFGS